MKKFNGKSKAVTFSFDDGVVQDVNMIEMLNKYNLKATFNINSELLGKGGFLERENQKICHYKVLPEDVKHVYSGHEVAVHTLTHPNLTTLGESEIILQVEQDRKNLEELVGYDVVGMAYPCGGVNNDDRVAKIIKENTKIRYCRTITDTDSFEIQPDLWRFNPNTSFKNPERMMKLAEEFLASTSENPQVLYIWGHSYELDYTPGFRSQFDEFLLFIANREDVFYGTNREVLLGE